MIDEIKISAQLVDRPKPGMFVPKKKVTFSVRRIFLAQFIARNDVITTELKKWFNCKMIVDRGAELISFQRNPASGLVWEEENEQLLHWRFKDFGVIKLVKLPPHVTTSNFQLMMFVKRAPRIGEIFPYDPLNHPSALTEC